MLLLRCPAVAPALDAAGFDVGAFERLGSLLARARRLQPRACVVKPATPGREVGDTVRTIRAALPFTDVVVWEPDGAPAVVRDALLAGARDVVLGAAPDAVAAAVRRVVDDQKLLPRVLEQEDRDGDAWRFEGLLSRSQRMWDVFETCIRTAATDATVLILGETGTGKELIARAIHRRSKRDGRFVALNCGAVPETLVDSELFGHVEGAFTGASAPKEGLFRHAHGGTLFLDEIGNIPLAAQYRLLRTLQEETVRPVGGHEEIPIDVRVIAATSTALGAAVQDETFREDLLYRIDVIRVIVPSLRERPEDIVFLFGHFAQRLADHYKVDRPEFTDDFLDALQAYEWPGNVRELENLTERLLLTQPGERLTGAHFRRLMRDFAGRDGETSEPTAETLAPPRRVPEGLRGAVVDLERPLHDVVELGVENIERAYIESALRAAGGRVGQAAERAGISRRTLLRKLTAYGIDKRDFRGA